MVGDLPLEPSQPAAPGGLVGVAPIVVVPAAALWLGRFQEGAARLRTALGGTARRSDLLAIGEAAHPPGHTIRGVPDPEPRRGTRMADKDSLAERGRALEDDYFRKRDRELIEQLRSAAAAEQARAEMGRRVGLTDPELLRQLEALGFTPDTVVLLPLVPAVQMAWAAGGVGAAERELIVQLARRRGVEAGSAADRTLAQWLAARPGADVFAHATRLIRAMLAAPGAHDLTADELVKHSESVAAASGGLLGRNRISAEERRLLTALADALRARSS
jgi:hypothetical protein